MELEGDLGGNVVIRAHPDALLLYETCPPELRDVDTVERWPRYSADDR